MKKILITLLAIGLFGMANVISAIVIVPNTITNKTGETITVQTTRITKCLGQPDQTHHETTTIAADKTGNVYLMGGARLTCSSSVTLMTVTAPDAMSATLSKPSLQAKDYVVSAKTESPSITSDVMYKKLIVQ